MRKHHHADGDYGPSGNPISCRDDAIRARQREKGGDFLVDVLIGRGNASEIRFQDEVSKECPAQSITASKLQPDSLALVIKLYLSSCVWRFGNSRLKVV